MMAMGERHTLEYEHETVNFLNCRTLASLGALFEVQGAEVIRKP